MTLKGLGFPIFRGVPEEDCSGGAAGGVYDGLHDNLFLRRMADRKVGYITPLLYLIDGGGNPARDRYNGDVTFVTELQP